MIGGAFSQAEKFTFDRGDPAGQLRRQRQYGRHRTQYQQATAAPSRSRRPIRTSPTTASRARSSCTCAPPVRRRSISAASPSSRPAAASVSACRSRKSTRCSSASASSAPASRPTPPARLVYQDYVREFGGTPASGIGTATTNSLPLTVAWQRDSRDSAMTPTIGRYQRANLEARPGRRLEVLPRRLRAAVVPPLFRKHHPGAQGRSRLRPRHRRHHVSGVQELLRRRHRLGARLRELVAGRGRPDHRRRPGRRQCA